MKMRFNCLVVIGSLILSMSISSCEKFLEESPVGNITVNNYYNNETDAISAVNSIYSYLNSISTGSTAGVYHSTFWVTAGLASDEMENEQIFAPDFDQISTFTYTPENSALREIWAMHYKTISIANIAIGKIPRIDMDQVLRNRLVGEAKFLRGLMYFNLVRMFGDIPLILKEDEPLMPQAETTENIYRQIIEDLKDAETALPAGYPIGNGRGRATVGAARALLAKTYLTIQNWSEAASYAKKVIDSEEYELWEDFGDVFKLSSRNGKEAVFSVGFGDAGGAIIFWEVGQFQVRLLPSELSAEGVINAQGWQVPTENLYNIFDRADRRREVTFITEINGKDGTLEIRPYIQKFWDRAAEPKGNESSNDFPVIRYSDVLLMYAEAMNEMGDIETAHTYVNMIRKRARFDGMDYVNGVPDYVGLSKEEMREAILKERRMEFIAEGHRWFDLVRTNTLEQKVPVAKPGVHPTDKHFLFPIPLHEIDLNTNLKQNSGY